MKVPPYGYPLTKLIAEHKRPRCCVNIYIGENSFKGSFGFRKNYPFTTLVLPFNENPFNFKWPVNEMMVVIYDTSLSSLDIIEDLVLSLFRDEADFIVYKNNVNGNFDCYKRN